MSNELFEMIKLAEKHDVRIEISECGVKLRKQENEFAYLRAYSPCDIKDFNLGIEDVIRDFKVRWNMALNGTL